MRGIETSYAGYTFRSRLEARWAAFFDLIGLSWEYEPYDLPGWIPDFSILGTREILVDIKPLTARLDFENRAQELNAWVVTEPPPATSMCVILGVAPLLWPAPELRDHPATGVMSRDGNGDSAWAPCSWINCKECGGAGLVRPSVSAKVVPCGHTTGSFPSFASLKYAWGQAHGATRWNPTRR